MWRRLWLRWLIRRSLAAFDGSNEIGFQGGLEFWEPRRHLGGQMREPSLRHLGALGEELLLQVDTRPALLMRFP
jgi:hypothetical protein